MSTDTASTHEGHDAVEGHDDHAEHFKDSQYVVVALILAVVTAIEVAFSYMVEDLGPLFLPGLLILMALKFYTVVAYFMHLKFDTRVLAGLFVFGLALAVLVYFIMLSAFEFSFWNDGYCDAGLPDLDAIGDDC